MSPLLELAERLQRAFPSARLDVADPAAPGGVGFLDIAYGDNVLVVEWHDGQHFGVSSPEGHGFGEKPDEVYWTVDEAEKRIAPLLRSGSKTEPPPEVTLRELRAERNLAQTMLAATLGVSQPAVSRLENNVSRMMVATLQAVVRAMGGTLVLQAHFPDGVIRQIALNDQSSARPDADPVAAGK